MIEIMNKNILLQYNCIIETLNKNHIRYETMSRATYFYIKLFYFSGPHYITYYYGTKSFEYNYLYRNFYQILEILNN